MGPTVKLQLTFQCQTKKSSDFKTYIEWTAPRGSPNVNHGLGVLMTCQCRFINFTNVPSGGNVDGGGGYVYVCVVGQKVYGESMYIP